jgi:predicted  nucleic acid-binding Zn-ribbon protein
MARISTYAPDVNITAQDKLLGSSYQGKQGGNLIYNTANFKVSDLLQFVSNNIDVTVEGINYNLGDITGDISGNQEAITDLTDGLSDLTDQLLDQVDLFVGFTGSIGIRAADGSLVGISQNFADDVLAEVTTITTSVANNILSEVTIIPDAVANNIISSVTTINQAFADGVLGIADITEQFANDILGIASSTAYATEAQFNTLQGIVTSHTNDIDAIELDVTTLETNVNTNTGNITANATDISGIATRVTTAETNVVALQTDLTSLTTTVNGNTGDISTNASQISALGTTVSTQGTDITNLSTDLTSLTTTVNGNTGDIATNATQISTLGTTVSTQGTDIATLSTDLTSLSTTVNGNTGDIATNATNISTLTTDVSTAAGDITSLQADVTSLTTTVNGNTGDIATNATDLSALGTRVTTAESDITAVETDLTSLTTTVNGNTGSIATNATNISTLSTSVTTAQADITSIQTDVTSLTTTVNGNTGDIATNASDISAIGTRVTTAEADVTAIQGDLTTLTTTVNGNTGDISTNATDISTLATRVTTAEADITAAATDITTLTTDVATNTGDISTNATDISTLSTSVTALGTTVTTLSSDVTTLTTDVNTATGDISANATNITNLGVTVGDNTANITTNSTAIATTDGKLSASYGMVVNAAGKVAGLKLLADGTTGSSFIAQANEFGVDMPNGSRVLTVDSGGLLLNGSGVFTGNISARSGDFGGWSIVDNNITGPDLLGHQLVLNPISGISVNSSDWQDSRVLSIRKGERPITANGGTYTFTNVDGVNFNSWSDTVTTSVTDTAVKTSLPKGITGTFSGSERLGTFREEISWSAINGIASTSSNFLGSVEVGLYVQFANYFDFRTSSIIGTEEITSASVSAASTTLDLPAVTNKLISFVNSQTSATLYFRFIFRRKVDIQRGSVTFSAKSTGATSGLDIVMLAPTFQTDLSPGGIMVSMGNGRYFRVDTNSYYGSFVSVQGGLSSLGTVTVEKASQIALVLNRTGSDGEIAHFRNDGVTVGRISVGSSTTSYLTTSDYRLKENVVDISGALDRLELLKPYRFNFLSNPDTTVDGFIAHEVQDVVPEAIEGVKDEMEDYEITAPVFDKYGNILEEAVIGTRPKYQSIDQSKLVPLLVAAMQEMRAEYKAEIELLKSQINS